MSSVILSVSVVVLAPPGVASTACSASAQNAAFTVVLSAVVNQTTANGGAVSCAVGAANGRRNMQAAPTAAECALTASPSFVTYLVPVIVPPAGSATTALAAINGLTEASFNALFAANAAASGCNLTSYDYWGTSTTAACGTGATNATMCALPGGSSAAAANVGAIIGGVLGGFAAFAIFFALVLVARGACACCGEGCPRKQTPLADDGLVALPAAPALP
jgi:hypothetical protein